MSGLRLLKGALAGCIATGPMTVAMLFMHRWLPGEQRYALPPMLIARRMVGGKGPFARLGVHEHKGLTLLMHFGFGTSFGAVYALLPRQGPIPAPLRGILFALCVWAGSYLGWIPAAKILPPATQHPGKRNALMIIAHVIWGGLLGLLLARLDAEEPPPGQAALADGTRPGLYPAAAAVLLPPEPAGSPAPASAPPDSATAAPPAAPA